MANGVPNLSATRLCRSKLLIPSNGGREADAGKLRGMHSSIGQEAVPTGVCAHLTDNDYVLGTHRSHHHCIAKGVNLSEMMAELLGKATGTNRGKGGTMHIADINKGMLGANGVVGSNIPVSTGVALTAKVNGTDQVSVVFFGDGAANQGSLHESMNLASIWKLPVVFICENNRYAITSPIADMTKGGLADRAIAFGLAAETVDGMDVEAVRAAADRLVSRARAGNGAGFLVCDTYRFEAHNTALRAMDLTYRTTEEIEIWRERDPLTLAAQRLDAEGGWASGDRAAIDAEVDVEIESAIARACDSAIPSANTALDHMYEQTYPGFPAGVLE